MQTDTYARAVAVAVDGAGRTAFPVAGRFR